MSYTECSATGVRKIKGYWQLKIGYNIPVREQISLHERKEISLSSGAYSDPQTEGHIGSSLPRTSRSEGDYDIQKRKQPRTTFCKRNGKLNIKPAYSNPITEVGKVNIEVKRSFLITLLSIYLPPRLEKQLRWRRHWRDTELV